MRPARAVRIEVRNDPTYSIKKPPQGGKSTAKEEVNEGLRYLVHLMASKR